MAELGRLLTAMVTPFTEEGEVDYARAGELAKAILKSGSDGLVIGGTTGEAPSMSDDELIQLFTAVKQAIGDDGAVIAGTTNNNTRASIALSREAEKAGVDALLLTVPAYNKPTDPEASKCISDLMDAIDNHMPEPVREDEKPFLMAVDARQCTHTIPMRIFLIFFCDCFYLLKFHVLQIIQTQNLPKYQNTLLMQVQD